MSRVDHKEEHSAVRGDEEVTYAHRHRGPSGPGSGAGSSRAHTARTVGPPYCVGSRRTRLRSRCRSSCKRPGRSDTTWSGGYTHTLRKTGTKWDLLVLLLLKIRSLLSTRKRLYSCKIHIFITCTHVSKLVLHPCLCSYSCRRGCFVPLQVSKANHGKSLDSAHSLVPRCCDYIHSGHGPTHTQNISTPIAAPATHTVGPGSNSHNKLCIKKSLTESFIASQVFSINKKRTKHSGGRGHRSSFLTLRTTCTTN